MSDFALLASTDGKTLNGGNDNDIAYDSRHKHLQVDLNADPPHMNVYTENRLTAIAVNSTPGNYVEEVLVSIDHKLPFVPRCAVYFYVSNAPVGNTNIGQYVGSHFYLSGTSGSISDVIFYRVNETKFEIVHANQNILSGTGYTSDGPQWQFRVKYMIQNNADSAPYLGPLV